MGARSCESRVCVSALRTLQSDSFTNSEINRPFAERSHGALHPSRETVAVRGMGAAGPLGHLESLAASAELGGTGAAGPAAARGRPVVARHDRLPDRGDRAAEVGPDRARAGPGP